MMATGFSQTDPELPTCETLLPRRALRDQSNPSGSGEMRRECESLVLAQRGNCCKLVNNGSCNRIIGEPLFQMRIFVKDGVPQFSGRTTDFYSAG